MLLYFYIYGELLTAFTNLISFVNPSHTSCTICARVILFQTDNDSIVLILLLLLGIILLLCLRSGGRPDKAAAVYTAHPIGRSNARTPRHIASTRILYYWWVYLGIGTNMVFFVCFCFLQLLSDDHKIYYCHQYMYTKQRLSHYYIRYRGSKQVPTNNIETFGRILAKLYYTYNIRERSSSSPSSERNLHEFSKKTKMRFFSYYYIQSFIVCRYENIKIIIHNGCNDS